MRAAVFRQLPAAAIYQRLVLMLCTWACSPAAIGATTLPMSTPYLITVSPVGHVLERDLVADRDVLARGDAHMLVLVHDPAIELHAGFDAFDHHHGDGVVGVVQYEVIHGKASLGRKIVGSNAALILP